MLTSNLGRRIVAVLDQALYALTSFGIAIALARETSQSVYGVYALSQTLLILIWGFHNALLMEPMLVFGAGKYFSGFADYLGAACIGHLLFCGAVTGILLPASGILSIFGQTLYAITCLGLVFVTPPLLLFWLLRRACFAVGRSHWAAMGSALYLLSCCLLFLIIRRFSSFSIVGVFALQTLGCLPSIAWLMWKLPPRVPHGGRAFVREVFATHLNYGKWASKSYILHWIPTNLAPWLVAVHLGPEASAVLKALLNPLLPFLQGIGALATLLVPSFVRADGTNAFKRALYKNGLYMCAGAVMYSAVLILWRTPILHRLYAGRYDSYESLLMVVALVAVPECIIQLASAAFQSRVRPDLFFRGYLVSSAASIPLGVAIWLFGLKGAAYNFLICYALTAVTLVYLHFKLFEGAPQQETAPLVSEGVSV